ncbi:uncharacterized protein yc1106_09103 [Curvularia clavata]|uniref:Transcriptional activator HAP2 n=1 Tax=Curvularia clavata TaxID=95742 RepID=A0A9Q8ZI00_CURCL|nr:uncharacterized protein yc1106_09103 [Curvularia clavata]
MPSAKEPLSLTGLNVKQQNRIQKRRLARQKLNAHLVLNQDKTKMHGQSPLYPSHQEPNTGCTQRPRNSDQHLHSFTCTLERTLIRDINTLAIGTSKVADMSAEKTKL